MATLHHNISGELTKQLLAPGDNINVSKISLTNTQKVSSCKVDLYIEKALTGKFYLLKQVELPIGTTLIYDNMNFSNQTDEFGLYIKLTDGPTFTLTGTIDVTGTNVNVPGTNTLFLSELSVGDEVVISTETRTVATITSDTAATVTAAFGSDLANDTTPDCNPTALVDVIIN
tara:strand:+ start:1052 stop:1570 length:519 start_codon:yes stop_codon:yes gene_type:complete